MNKTRTCAKRWTRTDSPFMLKVKLRRPLYLASMGERPPPVSLPSLTVCDVFRNRIFRFCVELSDKPTDDRKSWFPLNLRFSSSFRWSFSSFKASLVFKTRKFGEKKLKLNIHFLVYLKFEDPWLRLQICEKMSLLCIEISQMDAF